LVVATLRKKLSVSKRAVQKFGTKSKNSIRLKPQIGLEPWENLMMMMMMISTELGKVLEYKSYSHRQSRL